MFRDKSFNISLFISIGWHLFWMFAVMLVIMPKGLDFARFPTTSFLGPILNQGVFSEGFAGESTSIPTPYRRNFIASEALEASHRSLIRDPRGGLSRSQFQKGLLVPEKNVDLSHKKRVPRLSAAFRNSMIDKRVDPSPPLPEGERVGLPSGQTGVRGFEEINGPLKDRRLVYKPERPRLPSWTHRTGLDFAIGIKIWVSPEGVVESVESLTTTGYPQIDCLWMGYARGWLFEQASQEETRALRYGTIWLDSKHEEGILKR